MSALPLSPSSAVDKSETVVILGSANADLVVHVDRRPSGGETLLGGDLHLFPGGKGANQAAAAARCGASVTFLGALGRDSNADLLLSALGGAGVDTSHVMRADVPTGCALIQITPDGENSIVVSPGANSLMDIPAADALRDTWLGAGVLVLALEIPFETVLHVVEVVGNTGVRLLLNAAPARTLSPATLRHCDPLVVNETEAREVLGNSAIAPDAPFEVLAQALLLAGARSVVITLGVDGSLITDGGPVVHVPAYRVDAVDTTGAGDAFVGAVAAELARGVALEDAVRFATAVSAVSVQKLGAQSSYVDRAHVERFIASHR
ncbi:ribokinase [Tessaracoccus sp. Z1128]